jgi:predicted flap endonuclease-1-like 5' DNA nuclease
MFGLDPFSRPVAVIEIILLLAFIAFVGWLLGRLVLSGRISSLRTAIADQEAELEECRRSKAVGGVPGTIARTANTPKAPPAFVHADPLLPAIALDDTPELIDVEPELPAVVPVADVPPVIPPAPPVIPISGLPATGNSEAAVLSRIAARSGELNFDRIGRAVALDADDLKDIVGVGPFLERKLHSLGIYTFRQIANFTKEDIDKVNEIIEFFPGRIERDNWVEQSKSFYERKYGSKS